MSFDKKILADGVVQRLIEAQGIYSHCNRSFDSLVQAGASSVDIPDIAVPVVKTAGTAPTHVDRKKSKTDTSMINVPLSAYAVPLANELLGRYESDGVILTEYLNSAAAVIQEKLDELVIAAAQGSTNKTAFAGAALAWADIIDINKSFDLLKVPKSGRIMVVDANLAAEFFGIDVVKSAISYNSNYLTTGTFLNFMGNKFFITGVAPSITVGGNAKFTVCGIYGPGLVVIINKLGEIKEAWDGTNLQDNVDMLAHAGIKLLKDQFAVIKYKP